MFYLHFVTSVVFFITVGAAIISDEGADGLAAAPWDDNRMDERIYADSPHYLTYQLNSKRYSVPYHPVARLRTSQTAGVVLPYAMITNREYLNDEGNRIESIWKPNAAELLTMLMNRRKNAESLDNTNFMRFGISKRTKID
ncbi:uncharacterized protein LOC126893917 [Daktulosphaira vitifoliae]|uniref:uncharacterized protein LOC126893917 n=1 Tax=Daktulosphaira vitifoliae TaxID=58002 RepID=UPI0021AABE71|nr:uncharacterized protein LOC126893917 [Daktulosphaira vitifoliae]